MVLPLPIPAGTLVRTNESKVIFNCRETRIRRYGFVIAEN